MRKKTPREKVQSALAALGIVGVVLTCEPKIVKGLDYTARLIKSAPYIDMNVKEDQEFLKEFKKRLEKNEYLSDEEKLAIYQGFKKIFYDWGYLLDNVGRRNILFQVEHTKIEIDSSIVKYGHSGEYKGFGNIGLIKNEDNFTLYHEFIHSLSDHGFMVGTTNGYGTGQGLNEGVTESITKNYFGDSDSGLIYFENKYFTDILSLIVGKEVIMDAYLNGNLDVLVNKIIEECPNFSRQDIYRIFNTWDKYFSLGHLTSVEERKEENKQERIKLYNEVLYLFKKMISSKYGIDLSETLITSAGNYNFLSDTFVVEIKLDRNIVKDRVYGIRKDYALSDKSKIDIERYKLISNSKYLELLNNLTITNDQKSIISTYNAIKDEKLLIELASSYSNQEMALEVINTIYNNIYEGDKEFDQQFMNKYARLIFEKGLKKSNDIMFIAAYYKEQVKMIKEILGDDFANAFINIVKACNNEDIIHYYIYSDIMLVDYNEENGLEYTFRNDLEELILSDSYYIDKDNNYLITDKEDYYIELWYKDKKLNERFSSMPYDQDGKRYYDLNKIIDYYGIAKPIDYSKIKLYEKKYSKIYENTLEEEQENGFKR